MDKIWILALAVLWVLQGCALDRPLERANYIDFYQDLETAKSNQKLRYYERPGVNWQGYTKVIVEPAKIQMRSHADLSKIKPNELVELTAYFTKTILARLERRYIVVNKPGPDVLRVRVALTDAVPVKGGLNFISLFMVAMPTDIGAASIEAEVLDSESLTRLFAIAERKEGFALNYTRGFTRWSYVKGAMRDWSNEFVQALRYVSRGKKSVESR